MPARSTLASAWRLLALLALCTLALQLAFAARIALMGVLDPQSTSFQRSEAWRLLQTQGAGAGWAQQWVPGSRQAVALRRAVVASEDAGFADHPGIEWDALERAWQRNQAAQARAERRNAPARLVGGSTITQQLAKNLFLSGERTVPRKAQEAVIAFLLEGLLGKARILEIYLNSVEWGEGVFGAEAAARHYFGTGADRLSSWQAARLAVMLPAPKRFERRPDSAFLMARAATVAARMGDVRLP